MTDNNEKSVDKVFPAEASEHFNKQYASMPHDAAFPIPMQQFGLTKREYFAAMANTPDFILQHEMDLWRGDGNRLPPVGSIEYCKMMKAIAAIDSAYVMYKADALLMQLNPTP